MTQHTASCDHEALPLLLDVAEDSDLFRRLSSHVESCHECRNKLTELSADKAFWQTQQRMLKPEPGAEERSDFLERLRSDGFSTPPNDVIDDASAAQLLAAPSHPEMLGRIGRYEVERVIGTGGMGVVFKAFDSELHRPVAVKVLAPHLSDSGPARQRFAREARAAAAVVHEHVVPIHNVETEGESPFLVMHFVAGESLQGRLDREGALDVCEILRIGMQTAAGLAAAHAQGLVHRDVKPSNILLEQGVERTLITDFGLARAGDDASLTRTGFHPGTPQYMSPEQARGDSVDARSDLFCLGSVLYAMCTGRPPFRAETSYGVLRRITDNEARPIREVNPNIPEWLCDVIDKLMAKKLEDRFSSATEVAELLECCLAHVQQPGVAPLPESLTRKPKRRHSFFNLRRAGVLTMLSLPAVLLCGMMFIGPSDPPDISGEWTSDKWGTIVLKSKKPGSYEGTLTNTLHTAGIPPAGHADILSRISHILKPPGKPLQCNDCHRGPSGTIDLKWSRLERRFNGTWSLTADSLPPDERVSGKLSLELTGEEIHGGWTTRKGSDVDRSTPKLASLIWKRRPGTPSPDAAMSELDSSIESQLPVFPSSVSCPSVDSPEPLDVLRSLEQQRGLNPGVVSSIHETNKSSVRIVVDLVSDRQLPVRHYPTVGPASLHLLRYRCTVYFTVTSGVEWPLKKDDGSPELETSFYIDSNHLHRMEGEKMDVLRR